MLDAKPLTTRPPTTVQALPIGWEGICAVSDRHAALCAGLLPRPVSVHGGLRKLDPSLGMGLATTLVTLGGVSGWLLEHYVLQPLGIGFCASSPDAGWSR